MPLNKPLLIIIALRRLKFTISQAKSNTLFDQEHHLLIGHVNKEKDNATKAIDSLAIHSIEASNDRTIAVDRYPIFFRRFTTLFPFLSI